MLPRLSDWVRLYIGPAQTVLVRRQRGFRALVTIRRETFASEFDALLVAVRSELALLPARTPVHVILSNHLVRFVLVPFSPQVVGTAALAAVARQAFRHVHGPAADDWAVSVSAVGERVRVAAAVDGRIRQGIIDAARSAGVHIGAIDPLLMDGFNTARPHLLASGWFATVEPARVTLLRTVDGEWARVVSARCDGDWRSTIRQLAEREAPWVEPGGDTFCQVAEYAIDDAEAPDHPVQRVISLMPSSMREAA